MPMKPHPAFIDTSKGHKILLQNSGLIPQYIKKKDYGKIPQYLQRRNEEVRRAKEYENFLKEQREREESSRYLSDEEREDTLERMRKTWHTLNNEYLCLPFVTDTIFKKTRKERLEKELTELEQSIDFFEKNKIICKSSGQQT